MFVFVFIISFLSILSVIPIWDLKNCSFDLLKNDINYTYLIAHRYMFYTEIKLEKEIKKNNNGTITHENYLTLDKNSKKKVEFENIESFYKLKDGKHIICPIGKYNPIIFEDMTEIINTNFSQNESDWNLRCYNHDTGFLFVFYLNNGENQVYDLRDDKYIKYENL